MARSGFASSVLVTGFPTFVARRLAEHILVVEPKTQLYCVVRSKYAKLATELVEMLPAEQRKRVVLLEGDSAAMDMGLSGAEFREVTARIDRIFHLARVTHLAAPRDLTEYTNVQGAAEAVELAGCAPSLRCLVMLTSASLAQPERNIAREAFPTRPTTHKTVVNATLARAERIAQRAMSRIPVAVLRPSIIVGDSRTGEIDRFDGPYTLLLLILTSPPGASAPLPIRGDALLNMVPVDFVVRAVHRIGSHPAAPGRIFHLVDSSPLPARRVFELVAHVAGRRSPRGFVPSLVARSLLRAPGIEHVVKSPRGFLELLTHDVRYDATNTDELLRGTGIVCPPFEAYVDQMVAYVQQRIRERRQQESFRIEQEEDPLS